MSQTCKDNPPCSRHRNTITNPDRLFPHVCTSSSISGNLALRASVCMSVQDPQSKSVSVWGPSATNLPPRLGASHSLRIACFRDASILLYLSVWRINMMHTHGLKKCRAHLISRPMLIGTSLSGMLVICVLELAETWHSLIFFPLQAPGR